MKRNLQFTLFLLCAGVISGCNFNFDNNANREAPLRLSMRTITEGELTLNAPEDITFECEETLNDAALAQWLSSAEAESSCDEVLVLNDFTGLSDDCGLTGSATVTWTATDGCGNTLSYMATFTVEDTLPPFAPDGIALELWPPNHDYRSLSLADCVKDLCETDLDIDAVGQIVAIYSDEPENANGDGNTLNDIVIVNASSFMLRIERQGGSNGRMYGVTFDIADPAGNATRDTCFIAVPHDQSGQSTIDDGPASGYTVQP